MTPTDIRTRFQEPRIVEALKSYKRYRAGALEGKRSQPRANAQRPIQSGHLTRADTHALARQGAG